jgi:5-methylcytosine-specific restriction enzyme A
MLAQKKRQQIAMPEGQQEYLVFYSSKAFPDTLVLECLTHAEVVAGKKSVQGLEELYIEQVLQAKDNAELILRPQLVKLRKLDQTIGEGLKKFYSYHCQICGLSIGDPYGTSVAHTHHIEYFCKSLNNDAANIMIVCPNHHGIIHSVNPVFDWEHKQFVYSNGLHEVLRLNKHL